MIRIGRLNFTASKETGPAGQGISRCFNAIRACELTADLDPPMVVFGCEGFTFPAGSKDGWNIGFHGWCVWGPPSAVFSGSITVGNPGSIIAG